MAEIERAGAERAQLHQLRQRTAEYVNIPSSDPRRKRIAELRVLDVALALLQLDASPVTTRGACDDCGDGGWKLKDDHELVRCMRCNPPRGVPTYTATGAQPARLGGHP